MTTPADRLPPLIEDLTAEAERWAADEPMHQLLTRAIDELELDRPAPKQAMTTPADLGLEMMKITNDVEAELHDAVLAASKGVVELGPEAWRAAQDKLGYLAREWMPRILTALSQARAREAWAREEERIRCNKTY